MKSTNHRLANYALGDRYASTAGRIFLTGTQALVRVLIDQARRDQAAGRKTAGFVSGYRGSPLGGLDSELWRSADIIKANRIDFLPAVNEDLAATAVLGCQQVESHPDRTVQAVFGMWYGKGPGVDRSGDALRHGNAYGSSPNGGVLVVAGDDHGCVSSSMSHQSDVAFMTWFMPVLNPSSIAEYLTFGEYGYALSRYSGMWVGFKAISETVESAASLVLPEDRQFSAPQFEVPAEGLHYRWPDLPGPQIEARMVAKKDAVMAFAQANPIDRCIYAQADAVYGIVTTGKGHLDLMEALRLLELNEAACRQLGVDIYKVGMVWPLAQRDALSFVRGKREILVVEEKRGIIESQFKEYFYDYPGAKPQQMVGKQDELGNPLIPWTGELSALLLTQVVAVRLDKIFPGHNFAARASAIAQSPQRSISVAGATRTPYFCSGCPHNTSTKVPQGSKALAGIGCHFMASWMDRDTSSLIQMGGEGVNWAASSRFTGRGHIFQNLGEGTFYHSGSMAIRQAVAAHANITYKILFNDAVAMTGGQPVDGPLSVASMAHMVRAEGVQRIAVVSDNPGKFKPTDFPTKVSIDERRDLDLIQRELREIDGVTVLIYEQVCAAEKRRRRKTGAMAPASKIVVINDLVCEGCGDCSVESNCLSVEPKETPLGRKRSINQSSCNADFSCLNGYCPSFITIEGAQPRKRLADSVDSFSDSIARANALPLPQLPATERPFNLLVTGVGGTGTMTVGALVTMAAHLEGKCASSLDFTGFAQKFGPVLSYVRIADTPAMLNQVRIEAGSADALIGCDIVVSSSPKASSTYRSGTRAVINLAQMPTGDIVRIRDASLRVDARTLAIEQMIGPGNLASFNANDAADTLMGDTIFANIMMLGFAWQRGLVPVSLASLLSAIELNDVAVDKNQQAFSWGRLISVDGNAVFEPTVSAKPLAETLDQLIERRAAFLTDYQDAHYAARYVSRVAQVCRAESELGTGTALTEAVARGLFMLMAYKDEYEVARLHVAAGFVDKLANQYESVGRSQGGEGSSGQRLRLTYHFASPLLSWQKDSRGRPRKRAFGQWVQWPLRFLAHGARLRGSVLDPFSYTTERRLERSLIPWFESVIDRLLVGLNRANHEQRTEIAAMAQQIRGFGSVKAEAATLVRQAVDAALKSDQPLSTADNCATEPQTE